MDTGIGATNAFSARPGKRRRLRLGRALFCTVIAFSNLTAYGQQPGAGAYQIEAVYLYDFSKFVEWPTNRGSPRNGPFRICVLGEDPFGALLDATLSGESLQGSTLVAKRISKPKDASDCKIVFVSNSEQDQLKEILAAFDGANILTVSDIRDFSQRGGMIQFVLADGKVRFEVNVKNAENAGLTLSSDLLEVALAVRRES